MLIARLGELAAGESTEVEVDRGLDSVAVDIDCRPGHSDTIDHMLDAVWPLYMVINSVMQNLWPAVWPFEQDDQSKRRWQ